MALYNYDNVHYLFYHHHNNIVNFDGREVSETERQFLMNWKAMRVARRKLQAGQMESVTMAHSNIHHKISNSNPHLPKPAMPLTLPALPARQLPRRSRRTASYYQGTEYQPDYRALMLSDYSMAQAVPKDISRGLKLPQLVPGQVPSFVAQQRSSTIQSLPVLQHQPLLPSLGLKPVHATGGVHNRFM